MHIPYFNAIKTMITQRLSVVKTVDWYNKQYERNFEDVKATPLPACYIDFGTVGWQDTAQGGKSADVEIQLHLVSFSVLDNPIQSLQLANDLQNIMQGQSLVQDSQRVSTGLSLTQSELVTDFDQLKVMILTYDTTIYNYTTLNTYTTHPTKPIVSDGSGGN